MAYLDIHKALTQSVIGLSLGLPIAYENTDFNPEVDGGSHYISVNIMYEDQETITKTDLDDVNGFLQVSSFVKSSGSTKSTYDLLDALNAAYPHAKTFTSNGQVVNIKNIAVNKRGNINGWYTTNITVYFWSDIIRA